MVTGSSAGGLATFLWANYVRDQAKASKVWAVPDSGIFLNEISFVTHDRYFER